MNAEVQQQTQAPAPVSFHETLEHGLAEHTTMAKFKDVNQLAKSYIELEGKLGHRAQEQQRAHVPEQYTHEAYHVAGENIPNDYRLMAQIAHAEGISPEQFRRAAAKVWDARAQQKQSRQRTRAMERDVRTQEARATLQKTWGRNYNANMKAAEWAAHRMGLADPLQKAGLNRDPRVMIALARMGQHLAEDTTLGIRGGRRAFGGGPTRADLVAQADKLTADAYAPGVSAEQSKRMLDNAMKTRMRAHGMRG